VELVRALLEVGGRELAMMTRDNGVSCLMINAANRHLDVVNALLEVGGRELAMLTADNGISCLMMSAENGHVDVVNALLEAGEREHAMLTADNGASCLFSAASDQCGEWACGCGERAAGSRSFQRPPGSRPSSALGPSIVSLNTNKSSSSLSSSPQRAHSSWHAGSGPGLPKKPHPCGLWEWTLTVTLPRFGALL